jgi:hypothetical protein
MSGKPEVHAWFVDGEIAADDPLAHIKHRARDVITAAEETAKAERKGHVKKRADRIGPAAALTADEAFTAGEVRDMWARSGLSDDELDSAANAALVLWEVEQRRR